MEVGRILGTQHGHAWPASLMACPPPMASLQRRASVASTGTSNYMVCQPLFRYNLAIGMAWQDVRHEVPPTSTPPPPASDQETLRTLTTLSLNCGWINLEAQRHHLVPVYCAVAAKVSPC